MEVDGAIVDVAFDLGFAELRVGTVCINSGSGVGVIRKIAESSSYWNTPSNRIMTRWFYDGARVANGAVAWGERTCRVLQFT